MQDNEASKDLFTYIAFGAGKYRCPGKFFAYHVSPLFFTLSAGYCFFEKLD